MIDQPISSNRQHEYITRDSQAKLSFSPGRDHPASCIVALPYFVPETKENIRHMADCILYGLLNKELLQNHNKMDHLVEIKMMVKPGK